MKVKRLRPERENLFMNILLNIQDTFKIPFLKATFLKFECFIGGFAQVGHKVQTS